MKLCPPEIAFVAARVWTGSDIEMAVAIAMAESAGDTDAMGRNTGGSHPGSYDLGLWQINHYYHGDKLVKNPAWRDPYINALLAYQVFKEGGWKLWSTFKGDPPSYTKWTNEAALAVAKPFPPILPLADIGYITDSTRKIVTEISSHFTERMR